MSHQDDVFAATLKGVLIFLVVLTVAIIIVANFIGDKTTYRSAEERAEIAQKNIAPVGQVKIAGKPAPSAPAPSPAAPAPVSAAVPGPAAAGVDGQQIYQSACFACHGTGAAGAPKVGDMPAWEGRLAQGLGTLEQHALAGYQGAKGYMPAKGGRADLSDAAVAAAVAYMVKQSGGLAARAPAAAASSTTPAAPAAAADGQKVYQSACFACHSTGAAGAPKLGDMAAWEARIAQGLDTLTQHAVKGFQGGKGYMPAKGGRADLSDAAVLAAVQYMVDQSR